MLRPVASDDPCQQRQHRLASSRIDRIGDQPRLGALERRRIGNAVGEESRDDAVDRFVQYVSIITPGLGMA